MKDWKALGFVGVCHFCAQEWGNCHCKFDGEFEFTGTAITDPCVSECGRFFVDPTIYYAPQYQEATAKGLISRVRPGRMRVETTDGSGRGEEHG